MAELTVGDKCPVCDTRPLELDSEGDIHCWGCGRTFKKGTEKMDEKPIKKRGRPNPRERAKYYDAHREDIVRDLQKIGTAETRKKWGIPPTTMKYMLQRWAKPEDDPLPAFPPFSNSWDASVQVAWLQAYSKLLDRS